MSGGGNGDPFVALRRALRSLLPRRTALAAGAGIPPRLAGLATILEKYAPRAARRQLRRQREQSCCRQAAPKSCGPPPACSCKGGLRRRHARQPHDGAPAQRLGAQLMSCAGTCGALWCGRSGTPGSSRSRRPRAARPLAGGRGRYARPGRGRQGALRHGRSQGGAGVCFATVYPLRLLVRGSPAAPPGWPARRSSRRRAGSILG